jgi:hypothetical protein
MGKNNKKREQQPVTKPNIITSKDTVAQNLLIVPDVHCRPGDDISRADYVAALLDEYQDIITDCICIGDNWDMESLTFQESPVVHAAALHSYRADVIVGQEFHERAFGKTVKNNKNIRLWYHVGNHENKVTRYVRENPPCGNTFRLPTYPCRRGSVTTLLIIEEVLQAPTSLRG